MDCSDCGKCCQMIDYLTFTQSDFERARHILENMMDMVTQVGFYYFIVTYNKDCPFYDSKQKGCIIYKYRPNVCREYPFELLKVNPRRMYQEHFVEKKPGFEDNITFHLCEKFHTATDNDFLLAKEVLIADLEENENNWKTIDGTPASFNVSRDLLQFANRVVTVEKLQKSIQWSLLQSFKVVNPRIIDFFRLMNETFDEPADEKAFLEEVGGDFLKNPEITEKVIEMLEQRKKRG